MLTEKEMQEIRDEAHSCERPLFFFHDDADGLCSFLQFYHQIKIGKWIPVKSTPKVDERFLRQVTEYSPDKIFVLDLAIMEQDFVDKVKVPIIWIDHHEIADVRGVKYYNPRKNIKDDNTCISKLAFDIFKENFWIAAIGTVADWQLPEDFRLKMLAEMPEYFKNDVTTPPQALFETEIGRLAKIVNFCLKGPNADVHKSIKNMTKIRSAAELLEETSNEARHVMKKYKDIEEEYQRLLKLAIECANESKVLVFTYEENKISLTGELSNELLYRYPDKIIVIARHHNGEKKISFRSGKKLKVRYFVEKAMVGINGRFGGHEYACGGSVVDHDWDKFVENLKEETAKAE